MLIKIRLSISNNTKYYNFAEIKMFTDDLTSYATINNTDNWH